MVHDSNVRVYDTVMPDGNMFTYENTGIHVGSFTYDCIIADQLCRRFKWPEVTNDREICFEWFIHYEQCFALREISGFIDDDKCCRRMNAFIIILWMIYKYQVT